MRDKVLEQAPATPGTGRRVGLKDIALRAGVSINTVSRAIRAPQTVRPELRRQIAALMEELDYVPNRLAGGLAGAQTEVVGVILTSLFYSEYAAMIDALQGGLGRAGLSVMIGNSHYDLDQEHQLVRTMLSWRPAGMVLVGTDHHPKVVELLATAGIQVVEIWEVRDERIDSAVGMDHGEIGRRQARHLIERGCRRIAFLGCVRRHDYRAQRRQGGCLAVLAANDLEPVTVTAPDGGSADLGEALLHALMAEHPLTDGIVCNSDVVAMGALRGLRALGRAVPEAVRVIGFGDNEASASLVPTLSTMRPPRDAIGREAADILLARIAGEPERTSVFEAELVLRESTAAASFGDLSR